MRIKVKLFKVNTAFIQKPKTKCYFLTDQFFNEINTTLIIFLLFVAKYPSDFDPRGPSYEDVRDDGES